MPEPPSGGFRSLRVRNEYIHKLCQRRHDGSAGDQQDAQSQANRKARLGNQSGQTRAGVIGNIESGSDSCSESANRD